MAVDLQLTPKKKRAAGERCCEPVVYPDVERAHAARRGLWAYYYVRPDALRELSAWLS